MKRRDRPPLKAAGVVFLALIMAVLTLVYLQFRGDLSPSTTLTMVSDRGGLVMDTGSKVTFNGVVIGRVLNVSSGERDGKNIARVTLDVDPHYLAFIPANVHADIKATTVFGNKYVALSTPKNPVSARLTSSDVITASSVTTEFNTLFETVTSIAEKVDPVKLNLTLSAAAEALSGWAASSVSRLSTAMRCSTTSIPPRCRRSAMTFSAWPICPMSTPRPARTCGMHSTTRW